MSRTDKFVNEYKGKIIDVEPGWGFPGECVSLVQRFIIEELNVKAKARGHGKDWRTTLINEGLGYRVDRKDIRKGDIIAWDGKLGHVAISLGGDKIFEQEGGSKDTSAKIASAKSWDNRQGNKGLVTRLYNFKDVEEKPKDEPTKKPTPTTPNTSTPKVEYVKVSGKHNLYKASTGASKYGKANQNLASRNMEVLARANGRVRVNAKPFYTKGKRTFDVDSFWLDLVDDKPAKKPSASKPKVEYASVGGRHTLYKASTGTGHYGATNQNLAHRRMEVLERKNGRVRVNAKPFTTRGKRTFDVDSFWVKL